MQKLYLKLKSFIIRKRLKLDIRSNNVFIPAIKGEYVKIMEDTIVNSGSSVGKHTYIGRNCTITNAEIGNYTSIANNVTIGAGEHPLNKISTNSIFYDKPKKELFSKRCIIGHDVWIGVDSIIRRGVKIGNGAVIGANSFVNSDIPDFAIAVGSPAKVIKFRFEEEDRKKINTTEWWEKDPEEAREIINKLEKEIKNDTTSIKKD